jgi:1-deoxy-D-xylulose-5-phosphate synthase
MNAILENLNDPSELHHMSPAQLQRLCDELREEIVSTVAATGGHLGASLGVVELTVALHRVFRSPRDKIIWDVGHQAYGHKLLTGRRATFSTLRQRGGVSGFPKRSESPHDMFGVGHASTSISAAVGYAQARDIKGEDHSVIAVIGDGALTGGMAFEGLNNAGQSGSDLIVVLNDNEMSIAPNVGALAKYLTRITSGQVYTRFESDMWKILGKLPKGDQVQEVASRVKEGLKQMVVPTILFEELGFKYFGPIDGHDLPLMIRTLESVRKLKGPVMIHTVTTKGKGYAPAEKERAKYHGVGKFDRNSGVKPSAPPKVPAYTSVFSDAMLAEAAKDDRIVAITAAMPEGTGLSAFRDKYPRRFFDVGIAEQHAVTFAAGLACEGLRPVVAIYSTFLQRAYDQVIHDVALQKLPVVFAIDRGGLVGEDGPTHHGTFDMSYLRIVPDMMLMAPKDEDELRHMLATALAHEAGPSALRYPRGASVGVSIDGEAVPLEIGKAEVLREGSDVALLALGSTVAPAMAAAELLAARGVDASVVNMRFLKPLDTELLAQVAVSHRRLVTIEENSVIGGLGAAVLEWSAAQDERPDVPITPIGIPDHFIEHASRDSLLADVGLAVDAIADRVADLMSTRAMRAGS